MILFASSIHFIYNRVATARTFWLRYLSFATTEHDIDCQVYPYHVRNQRQWHLRHRKHLRQQYRKLTSNRKLRAASSLIAALSIPSQIGNEVCVAKTIAEHIKTISTVSNLPDRVKTAVAEAVMNAMEHGNGFRAELLVHVCALRSRDHLIIHVIDHGRHSIKEQDAPDLESKLAGLQPTRGWGLFLIEKMVDRMFHTSDKQQHTLTLIFNLK